MALVSATCFRKAEDLFQGLETRSVYLEIAKESRRDSFSKDGRKQKVTKGNAYVSLDKQDQAHKGRGHDMTNKNNNFMQLKHLAEAGRELKTHTTNCQLYFENNSEVLQNKR